LKLSLLQLRGAVASIGGKLEKLPKAKPPAPVAENAGPKRP
jgi:hypothetical protein